MKKLIISDRLIYHTSLTDQSTIKKLEIVPGTHHIEKLGEIPHSGKNSTCQTISVEVSQDIIEPICEDHVILVPQKKLAQHKKKPIDINNYYQQKCHQAGNIVKFGIPNPTRDERRKLCKVTYDNDPPASDKNNTYVTDGENNNDHAIQKNESQLKGKAKKVDTKKCKQNVDDDCNYVVLAEMKKISSIDKYAAEISDEDDDFDKLNHQNWSKTRLVDKISILKEENKKLRLDNSRLRALPLVSEDLPKIAKISKKLLMALKGHTLPKNPKHYLMLKIKFLKLLNKSIFSQRNLNKKLSISTQKKELHLEKTQNNLQKETPICYDMISELSTAESDGFVKFGGCLIEKEKLMRLDKSKGTTYFTTSLMNIFFSKEEMATNSMTGKKVIFQKKNGDDRKTATKKELVSTCRKAVIGNNLTSPLKLKNTFNCPMCANYSTIVF
ncbi:unnamed protein product [Brassicogethes aeneus]|uniref:Uncharacterized protein n=1 Tax=Brassicogethes aeneus TaxID=1431903 RepID=A0A9P0BGE9_BRAAE|nr:unnamed protein product [Brassicogethes aeneus]